MSSAAVADEPPAAAMVLAVWFAAIPLSIILRSAFAVLLALRGPA